MLKILNKPYPFSEDLKYNTKVIFFISIGIFVFLWLFQPFEIDSLDTKKKYYLIVGFAIITFLTLSIYLLFIPSLFPKKFSSAVWTVKKGNRMESLDFVYDPCGLFLFYQFTGCNEIQFLHGD